MLRQLADYARIAPGFTGVPAALAQLEVELHAQQRQRQIAAIERRRRELRIAHYKEVKARKAAQRQYERDLDAYEENKENLQRQYKDAVRLAEIEYEQVSRPQPRDSRRRCSAAAAPDEDGSNTS